MSHEATRASARHGKNASERLTDIGEHIERSLFYIIGETDDDRLITHYPARGEVAIRSADDTTEIHDRIDLADYSLATYCHFVERDVDECSVEWTHRAPEAVRDD